MAVPFTLMFCLFLFDYGTVFPSAWALVFVCFSFVGCALSRMGFADMADSIMHLLLLSIVAPSLPLWFLLSFGCWPLVFSWVGVLILPGQGHA